MIRPRFRLLGFLLLLTAAANPAAAQDAPYVPGPYPEWERRAPADVGLHPDRLQAAIDFAVENETDALRDLERAHHESAFGREPRPEPIGPFTPRGDPTGVIVRHGYIVAEWGEPDRVDMTFSVTKSFLSSVVGLAWDADLLGLDEPVRDRVPVDAFASPHNARITWDHLLRQTSDWEGTLWDKPDWADRPEGDPETWETRARHPPGTVWKYNDVRVNALALAALHLWRRPLPEVLADGLMDPIGSSGDWVWHGYDNSWVELDGERVQSVSGGGHWGGGMWISARDMARFGLLTLRDGRWGDRVVLSPDWLALARTPTPVRPGYGFMNFFLNTDGEMLPGAPENTFAHLGAGTNAIVVVPEAELVIVVRWIDRRALAPFVERVLAAVEEPVGAVDYK